MYVINLIVSYLDYMLVIDKFFELGILVDVWRE